MNIFHFPHSKQAFCIILGLFVHFNDILSVFGSSDVAIVTLFLGSFFVLSIFADFENLMWVLSFPSSSSLATESLGFFFSEL